MRERMGFSKVVIRWLSRTSFVTCDTIFIGII
jgi:hypothetical protein